MFGWIFVGLSILGCFLSIFKLKICWLLWLVGAIGMSIINYNLGRWDQTILWMFYIPMDIYGYYQWSKDENI